MKRKTIHEAARHIARNNHGAGAFAELVGFLNGATPGEIADVILECYKIGRMDGIQEAASTLGDLEMKAAQDVTARQNWNV